MADILSVGIDIGTSTTQIIFSKLTMENTSGFFTVPHVSIVDKQIVYKSDVYLTPLYNEVMIDTDGVRDLVAGAFREAGYRPSDTQSGAVIITGESARKDNADAVLQSLSAFAGDFVVSAAGPDMESVIAGKGSGAYQYSMDEHLVVANFDVGGGTTNIVIFDDGAVIARACLDIGGRLICVSEDMRVTKLSPAAREIAGDCGVSISQNQRIRREELQRITDHMAKLLGDFILGRESEILSKIKTPGSSALESSKPIDAICFSGGVADAVYHPHHHDFEYGDIGILLGRSIASSQLYRSFEVMPAGETIRATVVGAGTYTTTISGSTITYTNDIFPMKNVPVLKLNKTEEALCFEGQGAQVVDKIRWFMSQSDTDSLILAMEGPSNPNYLEVKHGARTLCQVLDTVLMPDKPIVLVIEHDIAKAVGQLMYQEMKGRRQIVAIDSIHVEDGDYVDMGKPVMDGLVIPVVVKTLIFG